MMWIYISLWCLLLCNLGGIGSNTVYTSWVTEDRPCTTFLTYDTVRAVLLKLFTSGGSTAKHISGPVFVGMTQLHNMTIDGLDKARLFGPLEFERLPLSPDTYAAPLRMQIPLKFSYLEVKTRIKLRYISSTFHNMKAFVRPTRIVINLDFREPPAPGEQVVDEQLAYVSAIQITEWNGIRISGEATWLQMFRFMNRQNLLDSAIRGAVENAIRRQLHKILQKLRPSRLLRMIFARVNV